MKFLSPNNENEKYRVSIIREGTKLTGNLETEGLLRIDGEIVGEVTCSEKIIIGRDGAVKGNITCNKISVEGNVEGNIFAREACSLQTGGRIDGDIYSESITLARESYFDGKCKLFTEKDSLNESKVQQINRQKNPDLPKKPKQDFNSSKKDIETAKKLPGIKNKITEKNGFVLLEMMKNIEQTEN